jgi:hypothetical protein
MGGKAFELNIPIAWANPVDAWRYKRPLNQKNSSYKKFKMEPNHANTIRESCVMKTFSTSEFDRWQADFESGKMFNKCFEIYFFEGSFRLLYVYRQKKSTNYMPTNMIKKRIDK